MGRVAQILKTKITVIVALVVLIGAGASLGAYEHIHSGQVKTVTNSKQQLTQISYDGKNGVTAYALLQRYATVHAKHYSFGYLVTSINGVTGNGPKYWTFFVDGKAASVGASTYVTKDTDTIMWKLQ
jgi:hypothetical protein